MVYAVKCGINREVKWPVWKNKVTSYVVLLGLSVVTKEGQAATTTQKGLQDVWEEQIRPQLSRGIIRELGCYVANDRLAKTLVSYSEQRFIKQITEQVKEALANNDVIQQLLGQDTNRWKNQLRAEIDPLNLDFQMPNSISKLLGPFISILHLAQNNELAQMLIAIFRGIASGNNPSIYYAWQFFDMGLAGLKICCVTKRFLNKFIDQISTKYTTELPEAQQQSQGATDQPPQPSQPQEASTSSVGQKQATMQLVDALVAHIAKHRTEIIQNDLIMPANSMAIDQMLNALERWLADKANKPQKAEESDNEADSQPQFTPQECTADNLEQRKTKICQYCADHPEQIDQFKQWIAEQAKTEALLQQNPKDVALQDHNQKLNNHIAAHHIGRMLIQLVIDARVSHDKAKSLADNSRSLALVLAQFLDQYSEGQKAWDAAEEHQAEANGIKEALDFAQKMLGGRSKMSKGILPRSGAASSWVGARTKDQPQKAEQSPGASSSQPPVAPEQRGSKFSSLPQGLTINERSIEELQQNLAEARAFAEEHRDELDKVKAANQELRKIHEELQKNPDDPTLQSRQQKLEEFLENSPAYWYLVQRTMDAEAARQAAVKEAEEWSRAVDGGMEFNLPEAYEASQCEAEAETCVQVRDALQEMLGVPSGSPPLTEQGAAVMKGAVQSLYDTGEALVGILKFVGNAVASAVMWEDRAGFKEFWGQVCDAFCSSSQLPEETPEEYAARKKALEDIQRLKKLYLDAVDGHNCQLDETQEQGRILGHGAQLFVGPEVLNILPKVAGRIFGAAKGAQVAASLEKAAALQRGGTVAKEGQLASKIVRGAKGAQAGGHLREAAALQKGQLASKMVRGAKGAQAGGHLREAAAFQRGQAASEMGSAAKGAQVGGHLREAAALQRGGTVAQAGSVGSKVVTGTKLNSVESLIQNAGKLRRLKKGVREGWITGNADDIFIRLANQYGVQIQTGDKGRFFISGNIRVDLGRSSTSNILTLYIDNNRRLFKIRIQ